MTMELKDYAMDLQLQAQRVLDLADEAAKHIADGKPDSADLVLGVSEGKLTGLNESWSSLRKQLKAAGASGQNALDAMQE